MNIGVVVRADKKIKGYTKITFPIIEMFAKKWNAKLEILDHTPEIMTLDNKPHYRIMKVRDLLKKYDRIVCLDADMIILPNCPNPFNVVPDDMIGSIYEDKGSRKSDRHNRIKTIQKSWGDIGWKKGYTNAGIFVVSSKHRDIFEPFNGKYWLKSGSADVHLSYMIRKLGHKIYELPFKWNHMTMFSEPWNNRADRFNSYIIHYAGRGLFDAPNKREQIKKDVKIAYENSIRSLG